ncbi:MAG: PaaI family thioesterase [Lentimicrobiaceae bacterium]|nr:PaaI family thioesterase [Lentimicrobiaceae bacterium]
MRRKIRNVFAEYDYSCFGCSPTNDIGLRLEFYENGDFVETSWSPTRQYEGYPRAIHGGILAALIDETAAWTMHIKARCAGVTSRMNIRYRKPVDSTQKEIFTRGTITNFNRNLCYIHVEVLNEQGELCTEAEVVYFTFSKEKSVQEHYFPADFNRFFE